MMLIEFHYVSIYPVRVVVVQKRRTRSTRRVKLFKYEFKYSKTETEITNMKFERKSQPRASTLGFS